MTTNPPTPESTVFLAWTDPALAGDTDAELAQTSVLQCLALVLCYVRGHPGTPADQLWSEALSQLPLISTGAQNTQTETGGQLAALTGSVARDLADLAGAGTTGAGAVAALLPVAADATTVRCNVVQTVVSRRSGPVTAAITHLVLTGDAVEHPSLPPLPPRREWSLTQTVSVLTLDYQQLTDPATRASWDELMAGVDTAQVSASPSYHRLTL
ncbi:MAG TPA: hypothetical protein PKE46_03425 [Micropruina sp.]|nr:hypothetical protein [Micropruina sp.]HMR21167.1 hypothetical protein [Micropruina sp.]